MGLNLLDNLRLLPRRVQTVLDKELKFDPSTKTNA